MEELSREAGVGREGTWLRGGVISLWEVFRRVRNLNRDHVLTNLPSFTTVASNNSFN